MFGMEIITKMKLLDSYLKSKQKIFDYFGYCEDWVAIPLEDCRGYYWTLYEEAVESTFLGGYIDYAETKKKLLNKDKGDYCSASIYTQRFLKQWVYRAKEYTMICIDTHVDGNKFLAIYDNAKEIKK